MKILIVEDDVDVLAYLKEGLESSGFVVDSSEDGGEGSLMAKTNDYDLVILDLNLPNKNGDIICKELRENGRSMPILMLTVETDVDSKVKLLNSGADDYLTKPFSFKELLARVNALFRRPKKLEGQTLQINDLTLDVSKQKVTRAGEEIHLTLKEFQLLEYLMRREEEIVSKVSILENVWGSEVDLFSNTIETHMLNLRKKINKDHPDKFIKTVSGRGYKII